jgi:hypothetical protein
LTSPTDRCKALEILDTGMAAGARACKLAELVLATTDWSYNETANEPAQLWEPLILPSDPAP